MYQMLNVVDYTCMYYLGLYLYKADRTKLDVSLN